MRVRHRFFCFAIVLLLAQPVFAAVNPWFGTWKLNRAKSTMTGDTYTIAKAGDAYRIEVGTGTFIVKDNGQDVPTLPNRTISLKKTAENQWLEVRKNNGKETSRSEMKLSPDSKTLTRHTSGTHADGGTYVEDATADRVGTGSGLAATWRTVQSSSSEPETLLYSDAGGGAMRMESTESKSVIVTHFDGQPAPDTGPHATPGQALAIQATSLTSYTWTLFLEGKPFVKGNNKIAADGKSFLEQNWLISKPDEKYTMIYERQ